MNVISVSNRKGGIGKTTVSINVARELVQRGYLVLMVDLDSQCDLSDIYTKGYRAKRGEILKLLEGKDQIASGESVVEIMDNLYLIPGSRDLMHLDANIEADRLKNILSDEYLEEVEYVIIDHPPNINEAALQGFVASDYVIMPLEPEALCMDNIERLLDDLELIQEEMNPDMELLGMVLNRIDNRRGLTERMIARLEKAFGDYLFKARISNNTAIPTSMADRVALRDLHWRSKTVSQFQKLVSEIEERIGD